MMRISVLLFICALTLGMARKPPERKSGRTGAGMDVSQLMVANAHWSGLQCKIAKPGARVIKNTGDWQALWKEAFAKDAPPVDFSKRFAVAVFAGVRHTGGYSVEFLEPTESGGEIIIRYRIKAPGKGSFVIQAFTQPHSVQLFKAVGKNVRVEMVR